MQAIRIHEHGGPEVLQLEQLDLPEPGHGEIRVRVRAAGVNFIDIYQRSGLYPLSLPATPGLEGAGVVDALGEGVDDPAVGTRVAWAGQPGSCAEYVCLPAERAVPLPDAVDETTAAAVMLQGMTAHFLCHGVRETRQGDVAVVHAAAGGAGRLLVQMLHQQGATVIGTVSTDEKARLAKAGGADHIIRYDRDDYLEQVLALTENRGADVVYDSVGQATFDASLDSLRARGMLVLFGQSSGPVEPVGPARLAARSLFLTRPTLFHYVASAQELHRRAGAVLDAVADGSLEVRIDRILPLAEAAQAHELLASRATAGKLLLQTD